MGTAKLTGPTPETGDLATTSPAAGVTAAVAAPSATAERAAQRGHETVQPGYDELAALMRGNLGATLASSRAMTNGLQALNAELIGFVQGRVRHGLDHGRGLAACGSAREALELQAAYVNDTLRAYVDELARLGELVGKLMNDGWTPLARRAEAATADAGGAGGGARRAAS
jgi:hypothetical protein